jgi:hypothetical protein
VKNEELSQMIENILHTVERTEANWIGHTLRRNCFLTHVIEGKIEVKEKRGRRFKQLLDGHKEKRRHWKLKEKALRPTL